MYQIAARKRSAVATTRIVICKFLVILSTLFISKPSLLSYAIITIPPDKLGGKSGSFWGK